jgi:MtN3 and saliva related transmembrane protein
MIIALGLMAGTLTTMSWLPQVARAVRTRSTHDLSWGMLALFASGVLLWLAYGLAKADPTIIAANGVTALLVACLVALKAVHSHSSRRV